ncbi:TPA: hypothetical protein ACKSNQ_000266 [Streptococcus pyogenes]
MKIDVAKWREILTLCFLLIFNQEKQSPQGLRGSSPLEQIKML